MARRFVAILAGGDGTRVRAWTRSPAGTDVPKQFCRLSDGRSLLSRTLERARSLVPDENIVAVVRNAHRLWWSRDLADLDPENIIEETDNRGTATAVLRALVEVLSRDEEAMLVVMPSDHHVEDEQAMIRAVADLAEEAERWPNRTILLGVEKSGEDRDLGYIIPTGPALGAIRSVAAFVEKPRALDAARLQARGALANTFVFASRAAALMDLYEVHLPELFLALDEFAWGHGPASSQGQGRRFIRDFSRDLLEAAAHRLKVLRAPNCGWTDLGTPARLEAWFRRHGEAFLWDEEVADTHAAVP